jgi:hypothetical protein
MLTHLVAACAWSMALAVVGTLIPLPCVAATSTDVAVTKQSAAPGYGTLVPDNEVDHSKPAGNQGDVKDAKPSASNASGLTDSDLAKRILLRCRARPGLCVKQRDDPDAGPPRNPAQDNQRPE